MKPCVYKKNETRKLLMSTIATLGLVGLLTMPVSIASVMTPDIPSNVPVGAVVCMDCPTAKLKWQVPGKANDHCALYLGNNQFIESCGEVRYISWQDLWETHNNIWFGKVRHNSGSQPTSGEVTNVVNWATTHEGDAFQYSTELRYKFAQHPDDIYPSIWNPWYSEIMDSYDEWTCSEFVWAAWYHCNSNGIDIDENAWATRIGDHGPYVWPGEILSDWNTVEVWKCKWT